MTPEEVAADLLARMRVHRGAERYYEAIVNGTGNIERIFHRPNSAWEKKYRRPDVELIVKNDDGEYSYLADYHVEAVES